MERRRDMRQAQFMDLESAPMFDGYREQYGKRSGREERNCIACLRTHEANKPSGGLTALSKSIRCPYYTATSSELQQELQV